jgi:hypothetical protein
VTLLAVGSLEIGLTIVALIVVLTAIAVARSRRSGDVHRVNATFLEWDPVERTRARRATDDEDVHHLLAMNNERRAAQGLPPETLEEYAERVRKRL